MPSIRRIAPLLFASGFCALVYQVAWLREFRLVFGASTAASAAVVAIFIGGLGVGGLLIGPRADRYPRPLALYARLEAWVALAAAVTPALLWVVRETYVALGGTLTLGLVGGTLLRLALAALVLAFPTLLMGGTLPAAARAVTAGSDEGRRQLAVLYGVNTLGAVTGAFIATFFMLEVFGTRRTLWLACLLNLLIAVAARRMARALPAEPAVEPSGAAGSEATAPLPFVLVSAAVVGFAFFLMELVWYRMLAPILGGSIYTFGLILSVVLLGIGLGGAAYALRGNRPATLGTFAVTCLLEAVVLLLPHALGDRMAVVALLLRDLGSVGQFWGHVAGWSVICFLVVLPTAFVAGYQFPVLISLLGRGRADVGRHVGVAYAWNTFGALAGSLAGGFGLIPLLSAPTTWRLSAIVLAILGAVAAALSVRGSGARLRRLLVPGALAAGVATMAGASGPTAAWRHSGIGVGRSPTSFASPNDLRGWLHVHRRLLRWDADGTESSVALVAYGPGFAFVVNGKVDGNSRDDAPTMVMSGLLGAILHAEPRRALVIGLGTGGTAGWLAAVPEIERVDVVELEPLVLRVARDCRPVNRDVMGNPKARIMIGDAREALLVSKERYDVIFSEPSNPYRAGIASLFTREYYQAITERLREEGLFLQWVQAYEIDGQTLGTIYATLAAVFPAVETWQVGPQDLILVASNRPLAHDVARLRDRLAEEPYRSGLRYAWRVADLEGFFARFVAGPSFSRGAAAAARGWINTDDHNVVEFGFARTVGKARLLSMNRLREASAQRGEDRPRVTGGELDWGRLVDERIGLEAAEGRAPVVRSHYSGDQQTLARALALRASRDAAGALEAWRSLEREPRNPTEQAAVAWALADRGDSQAERYIAEMAATEAVAADSLRARLAARQGRFTDAATILAAAFRAYRQDPWPLPKLMQEALDLAVEVSQRQPDTVPRLFESLSEPFVLHAFEDVRVNTLAEMVARMDLASSCRQVVAPLEPHVPWERAWLLLRHRCYVALGDRAATRAAEDVQAFLEHEPDAFQLRLAGPEPAETRRR
jgi:spermidine synthase